MASKVSPKVANSNNTNKTAKQSSKSLLTPKEFLGKFFDPKNGFVGKEFTNRRGQKALTKSFNAVTSGFNEAVRLYYGIEGKAFLEQAQKDELVSLRPVSKPIPSVLVYQFDKKFPSGITSNRGQNVLNQIGLE